LGHSVNGSTSLVTRLWISQALGSYITNIIDEFVSNTCEHYSNLKIFLEVKVKLILFDITMGKPKLVT
jgi:hypothetical protein